jgi:hypothetical protein
MAGTEELLKVLSRNMTRSHVYLRMGGGREKRQAMIQETE